MLQILYQPTWPDIYGKHTQKAEYTFFSSIYGTFFRLDYMLGNKIASIHS